MWNLRDVTAVWEYRDRAGDWELVITNDPDIAKTTDICEASVITYLYSDEYVARDPHVHIGVSNGWLEAQWDFEKFPIATRDWTPYPEPTPTLPLHHREVHWALDQAYKYTNHDVWPDRAAFYDVVYAKLQEAIDWGRAERGLALGYAGLYAHGLNALQITESNDKTHVVDRRGLYGFSKDQLISGVRIKLISKPAAKAQITDRTLQEGTSTTINISNLYAGLYLDYAVRSSDDAIATATIQEHTLETKVGNIEETRIALTAETVGTVTITLNVTNPSGTCTTDFNVSVTPAEQNGEDE